MPPHALLGHAAELLRRVLAFSHPADGVVSDYFRAQRSLGARERHTLAETVYAVLRQRLVLEHLAAGGSGPIERRLAILGWQGERALLLAALDAREAAWLTAAERVDRDALPDALRHNLPSWLADELQRTLGTEFWALVASLAVPAPLDLRVNVLKSRREDALAALARAGIEAAPTPHSPVGLRVVGKPSLHALDVVVRGEVEVQDEGSQLIASMTGARRGEMVVDFCAGAGGKTLALGAAMRGTGRLYALDTSGHRLAALKPRLARSGLENVHPMQIAGEGDERVLRLAGKADRVLVDAPCSGLGTLRRHPDLKWRQTPAAIEAMRPRQEAILAGAARLVKPGGRLVYATCSVLEAEDEAIVQAFEATHGAAFEPLPAAELLARAQVAAPERLVEGNHLRLWPHRHGTDGFFAAAWRRR